VIDTNKYKPQIRRYLQLKGVEIITTEHPNLCRCPNPSHTDNKPSAVIYDEFYNGNDPGLKCYGCDGKWDIFEVAGLLCGYTDFKDKRDEVLRVLGDDLPKKKQIKNKKETLPLIPLSIESARRVFDQKMLLERGKKYGWGTSITGAWPYINEKEEVEIIDIRFEGGTKKKNVVSFYWNGKFVVSKSAPIKIYNRNLISKYPDHIIMICEGAKKTKIAECLIEHGILPIGFNGGTHKIKEADWSCVHGRDVYFSADDDHEIDKQTKKEWPPEKQPGIKAALWFEKNHGDLVNDWKIITFYEPARKLKQSGADIEEILQILSPVEAAKYIKESKPFIIEEKKRPEKKADNDFPFKILGIAEDNKSYFIDRHGRIYSTRLDTLNQNKLKILAPLDYWKIYIGVDKLTKDNWGEIIDDMIELSGREDFNLKNIRGRGAWFDEETENICYHDGFKTYGITDPKCTYVKKPRVDIGLDSNPSTKELCEKIKNIVMKLSFETKIDAIRCLGWSAISCFTGASELRPPILITGPSSSGKSTIAKIVCKKLSAGEYFDGTEATAVGIRAMSAIDSIAIIIDETEGKGEKQEKNRNEYMSLMRNSFQRDSPRVVKGTSDGGYRETNSNNTFAYVAINSSIENVADENRTFVVSVKESTKEEQENYVLNIEPELKKLLSEKNCKSVRSLVFSKLKIIFNLGKKLSIVINKYSDKGQRNAHADGLLIASYIVIFRWFEDITKEEMETFVKTIYNIKPQTEKRDQAEEMVDLILEEKIRVSINKTYEEYSILSVLKILYSEKIESGVEEDFEGMRDITGPEKIAFNRAIENNGVYLKDGLLGIANSHKEIRRILGASRGYSSMLTRHPKCAGKDININRGGIQKKCTMIDIMGEIPF